MKAKRILCICMAVLLAGAAGCTGSGNPSSETPPAVTDGKTKTADTASDATKSDEKSSAEGKTPEAEKNTATPETEKPASEKTEADAPAEGGTEEKSAAVRSDEAKKYGDTPADAAADGTERATADIGVAEEGRLSIMPGAEPSVKTPGEAAPPSVDDPTAPEPGIGLLTAGEWNDNINRGFFTGLINTGKIEFPSFGIDPRFRTMVTVTSESKEPVCAAAVQLLDEKGTVLWQGMTDKTGVAYLFSGAGEIPSAVNVISGSEQKTFSLKAPAQDVQSGSKSFSQDVEVTIFDAGHRRKDMEIMFIVDSTGSMGDEMLFLQSEFTGIAEKLGNDHISYSVNFYRDEEDDYVTKCSNFTTSIQEVQDRLNRETADGGGDLPEAVDRIFEDTLEKGDWHEDTVKLAFLIFDAPPHEGKEESLQRSVRAAAEKGIRIIPVVSSNSDRQTELFGRAVAAVTGGTYVFLTDDSGVGESHLEPIIGDYTVEKLFDLIVRVAESYRE